MNRKFLPLVLLCLAFCVGAAHAAFINGQNYVPLADWAGANGFKIIWPAHNEVVLTNRTSRLVFGVDSTQAEINGVNVRLSFPAAKDRGGALIAQFDLDTAIRPLLSPSHYVDSKKIMTICLDPGHGGKDSGNRVGLHYEKNYTLPLAFEVRDQLMNLGFNVILTRSTDTFVDLPVRPAIANSRSADLFVSLHFNATTNNPNAILGPETYCITPVGAASSNAQGEVGNYGPTPANHFGNKSLLLAYQVEKSLVQNLGAEDRGVRRARFAVLRDATMPAILIEGGYMTSPVEGKKIYDAAYRKQMAAAIVKGILAYQKLNAPATLPKVTSSNKVSITNEVNRQSLHR